MTVAIATACETPESNDFVRPMARIVLAMLILLGVAGWVFGAGSAWFKLGMCAVTTVIECWGFNAAVQWSRAMGRDHVVLPFAYWTATIIACASWTVFSIYHALGLIAGDMGAAATPAYIAFTALALALPFHEWAIERSETAPRKLPVQAKQMKGADAIDTSVETTAPGASGRAPRGASRRLANALAHQRPDGPSKRVAPASETVERVSRDVSLQELRDAVRNVAAIHPAPSIRLVAENLNVPKGRVEKALTANRTTIRALAAA
jgi:hypothetical protein